MQNVVKSKQHMVQSMQNGEINAKYGATSAT
jgi:hypothetical protein